VPILFKKLYISSFRAMVIERSRNGEESILKFSLTKGRECKNLFLHRGLSASIILRDNPRQTMSATPFSKGELRKEKEEIFFCIKFPLTQRGKIYKLVYKLGVVKEIKRQSPSDFVCHPFL